MPTITLKAERFLRTRWYKLDTAGTLYPAITHQNWNSEFRLTAQMTQPVDPSVLQSAVDKTLLRFPSMAVRLKVGLSGITLRKMMPDLSFGQRTDAAAILSAEARTSFFSAGTLRCP